MHVPVRKLRLVDNVLWYLEIMGKMLPMIVGCLAVVVVMLSTYFFGTLGCLLSAIPFSILGGYCSMCCLDNKDLTPAKMVGWGLVAGLVLGTTIIATLVRM